MARIAESSFVVDFRSTNFDVAFVYTGMPRQEAIHELPPLACRRDAAAEHVRELVEGPRSGRGPRLEPSITSLLVTLR